MPIIWDYPAALNRVGGDAALLRELVVVFFEEYPELAGRLTGSLLQNDFAAVAEAAHSLKGSLSYLGAVEAAGLALQIERASAAHNFAQADNLIARLKAEIDELRTTMNFSQEDGSHGAGLQ